MTAGHCSRSLLLLGFLVYWGVLRGKCAATISNDSTNVTTKAAVNASVARSFATSNHDTSFVSFEDGESTTGSASTNAPRHSPRPRSRLAGGTARSNASEWHPEANRVEETTSERVSRGKKKFADSGLDPQAEPRSQPKSTEDAVSRSIKPALHDGYIFESSYPEQRRGDAGYDRYSIDESDSLDAIRNFNAAAGTRKADVVDVVKKPQGFALSSPPLHAAKHDQFEPANSAHHSRNKEHVPARVSSPSQFVPPQKRVSNVESVARPSDVVSQPKMAADAPPVGFNVGDLDVPANKNEIWKKPPSKLVASSSSGGGIGSYPKRTHNNIGVDDGGKSSLPTTSTAWALASMRTTDTTGAKPWRQPVVSSGPTLLSKKNGLLGRDSASDSESNSAPGAGTSNPVSGVKPFVSWSTRLQKTTTEHSKDSTMTPMTSAPQTIVVLENSTPSIAYAEPKLSKTSTSWTASVRGQNDEKSKTEDSNSVLKIRNALNSSEASVATETRFSSVGSQQKANATNDIVQNDVGSMFDREDADYKADQLRKGFVGTPSSVDATTSRTRSSTSQDVVYVRNATSRIVSSTLKATTADSVTEATAPESEHASTLRTTNSSDVVADIAVPASDILYGDEDAHQPANMTTIPTLMLVPILAADSNSPSFQPNRSMPHTSLATDSNEQVDAISANQTTLVYPTNSGFLNVTHSAAHIVSSESESTTAATRPSPEDLVLRTMAANVFAGSTNLSSTTPNDEDELTFPSETDHSFESLEKEDDFWSHEETTTATNRSDLTLPSAEPTVSTSSSFVTARVTSSSWPTFSANSTGQFITTSTISRTTKSSTTPMTLPNSVTTPTTSTGPSTPSTTRSTAAPPRPTTPHQATTMTSSSLPTTTSSTTTMAPTPASSLRTTMTPTSVETTTDSTTASTSRSTTASASPRTTTSSSTSTSRTWTGPTTTTTRPSSTFKPKIGASNMPGYLKLVFKTTVADICETSTLKENLIQFITQRSLRVQSKNQVMMLIDPEECREPSHSTRSIPVALYVVDEFGGYDKSLVDEMKSLLEDDTLANNTLAIHEIVFRENVPSTSRVIAAIVITSIAAVCFVLLVFLMCAIRSRQKTNYGQRCTPVSVDDYNLDNISEYNSVRRRGHSRMSRRSYSNPSFDDPVSPSKTLNLQGLTKAIENRAALDAEFSRIPTIAAKADELPAGVEVKNRYANVIPLPETRVSLDPDDRGGDSADDYINANYVKGFEGADKFYIACQGPLANTIKDFWRMVWNEQTKIIIMLTGLTENGVEKCADYLPPSEVLDCHRLFGDYQITLKKREVKEKYVISSLQLKNMETNLWREVTHLWYTNWPAQGVPSEQSSIIAFLIEARAYTRNNKGPLVVHCSPGTGRTGTVIAIDICIRDYESNRTVNVPATVSAIRRCRAGAVQTKEQYAFIYKVLVLYAKKLNGGTALDSM